MKTPRFLYPLLAGLGLSAAACASGDLMSGGGNGPPTGGGSTWDPGTLLDHLRKLGAVRAAHPALRRGTRASVSATNDTMVYKMSQGADVVWVAVNRGDGAQPVSGLPAGSLKDLVGGGTVSGPSVTVPARSSLVLAAP